MFIEITAIRPRKGGTSAELVRVAYRHISFIAPITDLDHPDIIDEKGNRPLSQISLDGGAALLAMESPDDIEKRCLEARIGS